MPAPISAMPPARLRPERLAAIRLHPALVTRRIEEGAARWTPVADRRQAHPDKPLEKGYARVEDRDGARSSPPPAARGGGRLRLVFGDGKVRSVGDGVERPRRRSYSKPKPEQPKLL
jgi:exodeoxyribonuclease VII large subunit